MPDPMTLLKADHREAKKMLQELADSREGGARDRLLTELEAALSTHMAIEEELVYPLVANDLDREQAEEAEVEHGLARDGLAKLRELVEAPGFGAAVEMLRAGLQHHIREEETELLPELKAKMEREEWAALGDALAEAKGAGASAGSNGSRMPARSHR